MPKPTGQFIQSLHPLHQPAGFLEVQRINHGEKVLEPGIYEIPMNWYHDDCCAGPSISSSGLRTIVSKSPLHYWDTSYLNKERAEDEEDEQETEFLRIGRAAHTLLLEPATYRGLFVERPSIFTSWQTKDAKRWRAEHQAEGYTVLAPHEIQRVNGVVAALRRHPLYAQGLLDGDIERALIWRDEKTGVWLKSRPDAIPRGSNILADLKVTIDARTRAFGRNLFQNGYDMQMALAGVGMWELLRRPIEEYVLVPVESKRPHAVRITPIAHADIMRAMSLLRHSLNTFAACFAAGDWPAFEDDNTHVGRSEFEANRLDAEIKAGRLPATF